GPATQRRVRVLRTGRGRSDDRDRSSRQAGGADRVGAAVGKSRVTQRWRPGRARRTADPRGALVRQGCRGGDGRGGTSRAEGVVGIVWTDGGASEAQRARPDIALQSRQACEPIALDELRTRAARYFDLVAAGETIEVARRGRLVARIVAAEGDWLPVSGQPG